MDRLTDAGTSTNQPSGPEATGPPPLGLYSRSAISLEAVTTPEQPPPAGFPLDQPEVASNPPKPNVISANDQAGLSGQSRLQPTSNSPTTTTTITSNLPESSQQQQQQWLAQVASQTHHEVRHRMSQAGDQLNLSIRQIYASASSIAAEMPPSYHNIPGIVPYNQGRSIGPPPSYDDVINPYAPPPTYHSLFGQMCEARKRSRGLVELLSRLFIILVSTLGCTILVAFMILIPFTMIIIGAAYIDECQIEHIPAFLLVGGLVWAAKSMLHCYSQCRQMPPSGGGGSGSQFGLDDIYLSASSSSLSSAGSATTSTAGDGDQATNVLEPREAAVAAAAAEAATASARSATTPGGGLETDLQLGHSRERRADLNSHHRHHHWSRQDGRTTQHYRTRRRQTHHHYGDSASANAAADEANWSRLKSSICESLLNCVLFGWFIAGCVIVFRNYEPDFDNPLSPRYCHRTVYMYTFWLITTAVLLLGLFVGCICCLIVSSAVATHQDDVDDDLA